MDEERMVEKFKDIYYESKMGIKETPQKVQLVQDYLYGLVWVL